MATRIYRDWEIDFKNKLLEVVYMQKHAPDLLAIAVAMFDAPDEPEFVVEARKMQKDLVMSKIKDSILKNS